MKAESVRNIYRELIDENPLAYKDIHQVMAAQTELVEVCHYS